MAASFEIDKNVYVFVYNQHNSVPKKVIKNLKFMIFPELYVALMMSIEQLPLAKSHCKFGLIAMITKVCTEPQRRRAGENRLCGASTWPWC